MMRRSFLLIMLAFAGSLSAFTQPDSALGFFPLHPGNIWQYHKYYTTAYPVEHFSSYYIVAVTGDSLMPNGKRYLQLAGFVDGCPIENAYLRVDSSSACVYQYVDYPAPSEQLHDSLRTTPGDEIRTVPCLRRCEKTDTLTVLGIPTVRKDYVVGYVPPSPEWTMARGFGLVSRVEVAGYPPINYLIRDELVYARIAGREFGTIVGISERPQELPPPFTLVQNYPNPFNPTTTIRYSLAARSAVRLRVFNILGEEVVQLVNREEEAGDHDVVFDGSSLSSGVYFYRIQTGESSATRRLVIAK